MFQNSLVALVTPMHTDGSIDFPSLEKLLAWHVQQGTDGMVILGTTGESATIEFEERAELIRFTVSQLKNKMSVIVGTGANGTQHAITLTEQALSLGADAALIVTPYYNKPTQEGLFQHYRAIANAVAIPQILYNVPGRTACDLLPETIARVSAFSNIVGVKEATGDINRFKQLKAMNLPMAYYSGDDETALDFLLAGGDGVISVVSNIAPKEMHDLCIAARSGDVKTAKQLNTQLVPLQRALFSQSNPIPTKWLLAEMGFIQEGIRLPLTPLAASHQAQVKQAMADAQT